MAEYGQLSCTDVCVLVWGACTPPLQRRLPRLDCVVTVLTAPACGAVSGNVQSIPVPGAHFTGVETETGHRMSSQGWSEHSRVSREGTQWRFCSRDMERPVGRPSHGRPPLAVIPSSLT